MGESLEEGCPCAVAGGEGSKNTLVRQMHRRCSGWLRVVTHRFDTRFPPRDWIPRRRSFDSAGHCSLREIAATGVDERVPRQSYRDQGSSHQQGCSSLYRFAVDRLRSVGGNMVDHSVVANYVHVGKCWPKARIGVTLVSPECLVGRHGAWGGSYRAVIPPA